MPKRPTIAKITRPRVSGILSRKRLFKLLDKGRASPVLWISGPGGSGKTTLVASWCDAKKLPCLWYRLDEGDGAIATFFYYLGLAAKQAAPRHKKPLPLLTPEYLLGIPTFTRRYFEDLYKRLKPPYLLVLDNYQDVPEPSPFHEMLRHGLAQIPQGINVVVLSRSVPPVQLSDLPAKNSMQLIEWEDLRFTPSESYAVLRLHDKNTPKASLQSICETARGWAAGLVLMTGGGNTASDLTQIRREHSREKVFDYFAGEVFRRLDSGTGDFMLMSSFLPNMTAENAEVLTGNGRAGKILAHLSRNNFFTEKHGAPVSFFRYHPLFREFLQTRVKESLSREVVVRMQRQAAELLEKSGHTEDAAGLCIESGDFQSLVTLLLKHAPELMAQGRSHQLEAWLASMPDELVAGMPWLLYWKGVCRLPFNPRESHDCFERALKQFEAGKDAAGVFLSWAGAVGSLVQTFDDWHQLDRWIARLPDLARRYNGFPAPEIEAHVAAAMLPALVMRQPKHPDFEIWLQRALRNKEVNSKINTLFHLELRYEALGYTAEARTARDELHALARTDNASPLGLIQIKLVDQIACALSGAQGYCVQAAREGSEIAVKTGVHVLDAFLAGYEAFTALYHDDLQSARVAAERMTAVYERLHPWERSFYHYVMGCEAYLSEDLEKARMHAEAALRYVNQAGMYDNTIWCHYLSALVLHELSEQEKANELLEEGHAIGRDFESIPSTFAYCLIKAQFSLDQGNEADLMPYLQKAMAIGRKQGIFGTHVLWRPVVLSCLASRALENQVEVEYVQELIHRHNLVPDDDSLHVEHWPWPIKIFTLGQFRLLKDGKPLQFSRKAPKKPLELLKALIAFGGKDVREDLLLDALWPEAEGDAASASYRPALHRLRRLIGNENAVTVRNGRVSLDPRFCWTDAWAFERMCENSASGDVHPRLRVEPRTQDVRSKTQKAKSAIGNHRSELIAYLEKTLSLYRGHFLAGEQASWTASLRERLQSKFLRAVGALGGLYMAEEEPEKAMECFEKGLRIDDLVEEFYQGLMSCNLKLGKKAEAIKIFNRCKRALSTGLSVGPSSATEELYRAVLEK